MSRKGSLEKRHWGKHSCFRGKGREKRCSVFMGERLPALEKESLLEPREANLYAGDQDTEGLIASPVTKSNPSFTLQTGVKAESCTCLCVFGLNADAMSPQTSSVFQSTREYLAVRPQGSSARHNQRCMCRGERHGSRTSKKSLAQIQ